MNEELKGELEAMLEADQAIRKNAMAIVQQYGQDSPQYQDLRTRGRALDKKHTARLLEIVEEHGWPGQSLVGEAACQGAFFVIQHGDLALQKRFLPVLREATAAGELQSTNLPLLEDRVRMLEGEKQLYGTQLTRGADGKPTLWPIEDEAQVEARRAAVGLEPLDAYLQRFGLGEAPGA